jgi:transcriptional regulator with XRE-family HTH domain
MELYQLRRAREQKGWSQSRVAEALGVTTRTVSRWEQGHAMPYPYYRQQLSLLFEKNEQQLGFVPDATASNTREEHDAQLAQCSPLLPQRAFLLDPTIPNGLRRFSNVFGRDHVLAHIKKRLLCTGAQRFTALHGLPGAGKTALAVTLATDPDLCAHFSDGVLWAGLGPQANALGHLARWGKLLRATPGLAEQMSATAWRQALSSAIGSRRFLIVIDDAWNLEDALALTVGGPNSTYLLTSRLPQVAFEFAQMGAIEIHELEEEDALTLVAHYVPQVVQQRHDDVLALVRAVGALPLALTLMGQYLASQALSGQPRRLNTALDYLHDASQRLHLHAPVALDARSPSLPENMPLSLYSAITLSVQQLDPQSQEMLAALAIFPPKPNSFSEEAALAVTQASVEALDALWDAGLLESSGAGRYTLHQTIVEYARARGGHPHARQRLVHYILQLSQQHEPDRNALEYETANVLVALDAALELHLHQSLLQGLAQFVPFMQVQGLELVQRLGSTQLMSQTLVQWGNIHLQQQLLDAAHRAFSEALSLNERSDNDPTISALAQDGLAQLSQLRGDNEAAMRL